MFLSIRETRLAVCFTITCMAWAVLHTDIGPTIDSTAVLNGDSLLLSRSVSAR